ncbi:UNC5C-like protein [Diadema setosum]|uniref:UNC5C-like protein n=1 Tax=Diadema setosum TaxID=31175 RepID=UPI003B3AD863
MSQIEYQANPRITGSFDETGGELVMEEYGVRMLIPAGAIETGRELISLELLSTTPRINLSPDEMIVCWALRCEPSHLEFKKTITITTPHCAEMVEPDDVCTACYCWSEYRDGQPYAVTKIEGHQGEGGRNVQTCTVLKEYLELRINHFSWHLMSLIRKNIPSWRRIKKRVLITPYMPRSMPQSRVLHLRIHVYDDQKGHDEKIMFEEGKSGYSIVHPSVVLGFERRIDVTLRCEDHTLQNVHEKVVPFMDIFHNYRSVVSVELDFRHQQTNQKFITLHVGHKNVTRTLEIITFNGTEDAVSLPLIVCFKFHR